MPRKPTRPFGYMNFGKDGHVEKVLDQLPADKQGQETEIAERFARGITNNSGKVFKAEMCPEADHDFYLVGDEERILVQATEIVARDFLISVDLNGCSEDGRHFQHIQVEGGEARWGMDIAAYEAAILARVRQKLAKNYSKPKCPLWLLIWSVESSFFPFFGFAGKLCISPGVASARSFISANGCTPFDEVWVMPVMSRPHQIWPINDSAEVRSFSIA